MRKTILLGIAAVGLLLSSCLGDNDTTIKGDNGYGVITTLSNYNGKVLAFSTVNYLTWDGIDQYSTGDALTIASYKFSSSDFVTGNVIKASYINVDKEYSNSQQKQVTNAVVDTTANVKAGLGLISLLGGAYSSNTFYSNRMFMSYAVEKAKSEIYDIKFVYDKDLQVDAKKEPLKEGYRVLDVVLTKRGDDSGTKASESTFFVADMTNLRNTLALLSQKQIIIGLRYSEYNTTTKECKLVYKPEAFYMVFE